MGSGFWGVRIEGFMRLFPKAQGWKIGRSTRTKTGAVSSVWCLVSSVWCLVSSVQCPVFNVWCPVSGVQCSMSSVQCPVSSVQCPVSSDQCQVSRAHPIGAKQRDSLRLPRHGSHVQRCLTNLRHGIDPKKVVCSVSARNQGRGGEGSVHRCLANFRLRIDPGGRLVFSASEKIKHGSIQTSSP
jgi:hypothetical protein